MRVKDYKYKMSLDAQSLLIRSIKCPQCHNRPDLKKTAGEVSIRCRCQSVTINTDRPDLPEPAVPYAYRLWCKMVSIPIKGQEPLKPENLSRIDDLFDPSQGGIA